MLRSGLVRRVDYNRFNVFIRDETPDFLFWTTMAKNKKYGNFVSISRLKDSPLTQLLGPFANNGSLPTRGVVRLPGPLSDQLWGNLKNAETPAMVLIEGEFPLT